MRPASTRQRDHGLTERPGAAPALPIHGAGMLTFARIRGIRTASGSTVAGPLNRAACPRFTSASSVDWNQPPVYGQIAVDLARRRPALGNPRTSCRAEPRAQAAVEC